MTADTTAHPPTTAPAHPLRWAALAVLIVAEIMDLLDATIVNVAAPSIRADIGGGLSTLQWVVAAYTLALAIGLMIGGRLGDIAGRKRMFLIGAAGFTVFSALCAAATGPAALIGARFVQGLFGAVMIPQVLGLIRAMFRGKELGAAMGVFGPAMGLAAMGGPLLGGWLVDADLYGTGWRSIFLINIPVGVIVIVAGLALVPEVRQPAPPRLDTLGAVLAALAAFLVVFPLVQGREEDWPAWTFASLAASVLAFGLLGLHQVRRRRGGRDPLVEPALFRRREFVGGVLVTTIFFGAMIGFMLVFNLFTQMALGFTAFEAGLSLAPWSLGTAIGAVAGGGLAARFGRHVMHAGLAAMIGGLLLLWNTLDGLGGDPTPWTFALGTGVSGLGMGMVFAPLFAIILNAVDDTEIGSASGVLTSIQQFGGAAGTAALGTMFFELIGPMDRPAFGSAVETTVLVCAGLFALTFLLGFLLPKKARADVH